MLITNIHAVYFSATRTTQKIVDRIAGQIRGQQTIVYDIFCERPLGEVVLGAAGSLLIVGVPVYAGRVPGVAVEALGKFKGCQTPAILVCVYGNRDYDDALLELKDVVEANGFRTLAAAAFVAQHSIFPQVASGRPDERDFSGIDTFSGRCVEKLARLAGGTPLPELRVRGNRPYKESRRVPLHPAGDGATCIRCGACVAQCPVEAIPRDTPYATDGKKCISCGHCIVLCPSHSRRYRGLLYKVAGWKFTKDNSGRREPEYFI